jgi:hypothetical protein
MSIEQLHNAYPDLHVYDYDRTPVTKEDLLQHIASTSYGLEIKRAGSMLILNESGNGKSCFNNNIGGIQADGAKLGGDWDAKVIGTVVIKENGTGRIRRFCAFSDWRVAVDFILKRVETRGVYIGGFAHPYAKMQIKNVDDLEMAYEDEWVLGEHISAVPESQRKNLSELYNEVSEIIKS